MAGISWPKPSWKNIQLSMAEGRFKRQERMEWLTATQKGILNSNWVLINQLKGWSWDTMSNVRLKVFAFNKCTCVTIIIKVITLVVIRNLLCIWTYVRVWAETTLHIHVESQRPKNTWPTLNVDVLSPFARLEKIKDGVTFISRCHLERETNVPRFPKTRVGFVLSVGEM